MAFEIEQPGDTGPSPVVEPTKPRLLDILGPARSDDNPSVIATYLQTVGRVRADLIMPFYLTSDCSMYARFCGPGSPPFAEPCSVPTSAILHGRKEQASTSLSCIRYGRAANSVNFIDEPGENQKTSKAAPGSVCGADHIR